MATIITNTKINYMPEQVTVWGVWFRQLASDLLIISAPLIALIWSGGKVLLKRAEERTRREKLFVEEISTSVCKTVIKEMMSDPMAQINKKLDDIELKQDKLDERIDDVYRHLK